MRTYVKRFIKNTVGNEVSKRQETRDGILWDILPTQRVARVKIQGSNTYVIAHYPENWESVPNWLKPGNAVRIVHVGGDRGRIELVGMGRAIPTQVSGTTFPTIPAGADCVLGGCYLTACPETKSMKVLVHIGSFRIAGTTYTLGAITCADGTNFTCADGGLIGDIAAAIPINAASAGNYRFDLISVGIDGVVDYTAGTPSATSPVKPTVASSHVALAYVLVNSGATVIYDSDINHEWSAPAPSSLTLVLAAGDQDIYWAEPVTVDVTAYIYDQYGNLFPGNYTLTLSIESGNGSVWTSLGGGGGTSCWQNIVSASSLLFTYTRNKESTGPNTDNSPLLKCILSDYGITGFTFIRLYDSTGVFMGPNYTPIP